MNPAPKPSAVSGLLVRQNTATGTIALLVFLAAGVLAACLPLLGNTLAVQWAREFLMLLALASLWNLLAGYAGLVSVGQQAFVGFGAYAFLHFSLSADKSIGQDWTQIDPMTGLGKTITLADSFPAWMFVGPLHPLASVLLAMVLGGLLAVPLSWIVFRLRGPYFAIGTWVVAVVVQLVVGQLGWLGKGTGTAISLDYAFRFGDISAVHNAFQAIDPDTKKVFAREAYRFWMMLAATMAILLGILVVIRSRIGLALAAIRDNEAAASALGVNPTRLKLLLFVAVGAATALVGAIGAFDESGLLPVKNFSLLEYTAFIIFIVVIGGIGSFEGPIIGTVIYFVADKVLTGLVGEYFYIVLGVIGILVMLFAPKGLWGLVQERAGFTLFPVRRHVIFGNKEQDA